MPPPVAATDTADDTLGAIELGPAQVESLTPWERLLQEVAAQSSGGVGVAAEGLRRGSAPAGTLPMKPCMYDTTARHTSTSKDEVVDIPAAPGNTTTPSIYEAGAYTLRVAVVHF